MPFFFLKGLLLRCEGEKEPTLQSLIDVAEKPKIQDVFYIAGRVLSETAVNENVSLFCLLL